MQERLVKLFNNRVILVVGGTGSIGSEIVRKLAKIPVRQIRVFSRDEYKQHIMHAELGKLPLGKVTFLIGDIRDRERVFLAMEGVDMVFNAAALKHIHHCEYNPFEAIKTNVLGTQNLVDAARANNIEKFVQISTDKAAMPVNVMGATKLLAEKIVLSAEHYKGSKRTVFSAVRFGNVFGSRGSVVPLFYKQIQAGKAVTLTDKSMTRFIMEIPDAAELVLKAALLSRNGELFILKMPVVNIHELSKQMINILAPVFGHDPKNIKIKIIGKKKGEKIYELLMADEESEDVYENEDMYCLTQTPLKGFRKSTIKENRSDQAKLLTGKHLTKFIKRHFKHARY